MKYLLIFALVMSPVSTVFSQNIPPIVPKHYNLSIINVTLLGGVSRVSLNYKYVFNGKKNFKLIPTVGLGFAEDKKRCIMPPCPGSDYFMTVPHGISALIGRGQNFFELGIEGNYITDGSYVFYPLIAYRLFPESKRYFHLRIFAAYPFFETDDATVHTSPIGFSIGRFL